MKDFRKDLLELKDDSYKEFHKKLMPTVDEDTIIGIRMPVLKKYAKDIVKQAKEDEVLNRDIKEFLNTLPHQYYEENNLHMLFVSAIKDIDEYIDAIDVFVPYINNWATCDFPLPKICEKHPDKMLLLARKYMADDRIYIIRFGVGIMMRMFLDDLFDDKYFKYVEAIKSDEYYVNMMRAWYFATALAKQYNEAVKVIERKSLDVWTHNKSIQKAVESYRVSTQRKEYLKTLKIKG